jgi:tetratricopeptide (TPR) repeat protein
MNNWLILLLGILIYAANPSSAGAYDLRTRASRILVHEAQAAYEQGNTVQAMTYYQQAVERAPKNVEALNGLAIVEEQIGALTKAQMHWEKAIALDPNFLEPYTRLGFLNLKQQNLAQAVDYFEQCVAKAPFGHPQGVKARQGLDQIAGNSPYYKERLTRAQAQEMSAQLDQRKADALYNQVNSGKTKLQEGKKFFEQRHYQDAIVAFNVVLKQVPGHPEALRLRAASALALRKETNNALTDAAIEQLIHQ